MGRKKSGSSKVIADESNFEDEMASHDQSDAGLADTMGWGLVFFGFVKGWGLQNCIELTINARYGLC
ncbi:hypothetical protein C2S53_006871 [Perilla frutescens var. hirtella]|uniref:Uncharacterized protein n=1 Tax=Perilla frutescens var. hirtella TaxID=608512 RepID=A0AAD4J2Y0_PERFH|nr:hypothetical protein C2S53_006871 [Perilla frutescens var. hirtella]